MTDTQIPAIRRLEHRDVRAVLQVIGSSSPAPLEFSDYDILQTYRRRRSAYFVAVVDDQIIGGAGIAPLPLSDGSTCELQRMHVLPGNRGHGIGRALMVQCLQSAREFLYRRCYLETHSAMISALEFYERQGFRHLPSPEGATGHSGADRWMMLELQNAVHAF